MCVLELVVHQCLKVNLYLPDFMHWVATLNESASLYSPNEQIHKNFTFQQIHRMCHRCVNIEINKKCFNKYCPLNKNYKKESHIQYKTKQKPQSPCLLKVIFALLIFVVDEKNYSCGTCYYKAIQFI